MPAAQPGLCLIWKVLGIWIGLRDGLSLSPRLQEPAAPSQLFYYQWGSVSPISTSFCFQSCYQLLYFLSKLLFICPKRDYLMGSFNPSRVPTGSLLGFSLMVDEFPLNLELEFLEGPRRIMNWHWIELALTLTWPSPGSPHASPCAVADITHQSWLFL